MQANEKAQVRPPRLRETKPSRANWHGSKASPAAIWFDIVFITQNSRLNYKEPQTGEISRACSKAAQKEKKATKNGRTFVPFVAFCWDVFKIGTTSLWSNEKAQVRPP